MATYTIRGSSHNVVYTYQTSDGARKQQWESYNTELEAIQRKAYIDFLQMQKRPDDIQQAALDYKRKRAIEKSAQRISQENPDVKELPTASYQEDNTHKTYREFMQRFLPVHARSKGFSPKTYDSYVQNLETHIYPYFGDWVMSSITPQAIDDFIDYLRRKPCRGSKSYGKKASEIPTLSSPTVKKCYNILMLGFPTAKRWGYITEIPETTPPSEKTKKRRAWEPKRVLEVLDSIENDPLLHLAVHLGFICSLRSGEVVGLEAGSINFRDRSMWITQIVERVSDDALRELPEEKIIKVFPKQVSTSKSRLILKDPKTDGSVRKQYLTTPLLHELKGRLEEIAANKAFFGEEYQDHGLLICQPNGCPIDPNNLCKAFKKWQTSMHIEDQIEFQGLRKSGQMHKIRLSKNNYQLVAESAGQSPEVLMSNYNEALEDEKRTLSLLVETDFYPSTAPASPVQAGSFDPALLMEKVKSDPGFSAQLLQLLLSNAVNLS